jgi:hypothetical protein
MYNKLQTNNFIVKDIISPKSIHKRKSFFLSSYYILRVHKHHILKFLLNLNMWIFISFQIIINYNLIILNIFFCRRLHRSSLVGINLDEDFTLGMTSKVYYKWIGQIRRPSFGCKSKKTLYLEACDKQNMHKVRNVEGKITNYGGKSLSTKVCTIIFAFILHVSLSASKKELQKLYLSYQKRFC